MEEVKILFVIENLNIGGAERVFVNLLKNFDRKIFNCKLVLINSGNREKTTYKLSKDIEVINLKKNKKQALFSLIKTIKKEKPAIVFSNLAPINILALIAKLMIGSKKTKYIIRETTVKSISIDHTKENKLSRFVYKSLIKIFYKYADGVIALSNGTKEDLVDNFNINRNKIKVLYNPIDIEEIVEKSNEIIKTNEINGEGIKLICVGSLVKSKGHRYLIESVYKLRKIYNYDVKAYFVGAGKLEGELRRLAEKLKMTDKVIFLGHRSNPFKYMKNCDIFVLPAIWEGFGNVIVEAMVCNIPVISTNCPSGPREIISSGIDGLLVEPTNVDSLTKGIISLIEDSNLYRKLQEGGSNRAKNFEIKKITKEYESYILSILKQ